MFAPSDGLLCQSNKLILTIYQSLVFASEVNSTLYTRALIGSSDVGYPVLSTSGHSSVTARAHSSHF